MLPRFFVPRAQDPAPAPPLRPALLAHAVDTFHLGRPAGGAAVEVVVARDLQGAVHVLDDLDALPTKLRAALTHHETAGGRPRYVAADQLWLFDLQLVEQPANTPGWNDPVHLYGRLTGPFPADVPAPVVVDGQLTVTRADLLTGLVAELGSAFQIADGPTRCLHALLPGDREEELARGRGVVLAYPLVPMDVGGEAGNEAVVAEILADLLLALQADLREAGVDHPLVGETIPVSSLAEHVRRLEREGWEIRGDKAYRLPDQAKTGWGGLFTSVFGVPDDLVRPLPAEGTLPDFLDVARRALQGLPGWPDRRQAALRARVGTSPPSAGTTSSGTSSGTSYGTTSSGTAPHVPASSGTVPPSSGTRLRPPKDERPEWKPAAEGPPDWMQDFLKPHATPGRPTRVTEVRREPSPKKQDSKPASTGKPDWMKDFED